MVVEYVPSRERVESTNIYDLQCELGLSSYDELYRWSVDNRLEFWERVVRRLGVVFDVPYSAVADLSAGVEFPRWFPDGRLNIVNSCLRGDADADAIVYSRSDGSIGRISYSELDYLSSRVALGLLRAGFSSGDRLAIDMPMTYFSVVIYLGILKAGCCVVSIADSFAPDEIAVRLRLSGASGIFTQDYIDRAGKRIEMYEKVCAAGAPRAIVLPCCDGEALSVELRDGDIDWRSFIEAADESRGLEVSSHSAHDYVNILFSSGTTGSPKVIPWNHSTAIKSASDGHFHHDIHAGDVVAWPTNIGWMMGAWLIFASLMNRATIALYHDAPTGAGFGRFVREAGVTMLGLIPSIVRAWRASGCMRGEDFASVRCFSSTGECSSPDDYSWLMSLPPRLTPIIEYCGGTEIGGGHLTSTLVQKNIPSMFSTAALGSSFYILDSDGRPCDVGEEGELFLVPPSMGLSVELIGQDNYEVYYEGVPRGPKGEVLRRHGDEVVQLENGYFQALGRADDTMNLGGIKVSSVEIERVINSLEWVEDSAATAVSPKGGGPSELVVYVVLRDGGSGGDAAAISGDSDLEEELRREAQLAIRSKLNPLFKLSRLVLLDELPRTATGKVMRRKLRDLGV